MKERLSFSSSDKIAIVNLYNKSFHEIDGSIRQQKDKVVPFFDGSSLSSEQPDGQKSLFSSKNSDEFCYPSRACTGIQNNDIFAAMIEQIKIEEAKVEDEFTAGRE